MPLKTKEIEQKRKRSRHINNSNRQTKLYQSRKRKKDAVIIDVGINRLETGKIVGDVDFEEVSKKQAISHRYQGSRTNDNSNAHKQCNKGN